MSAAFFFLGGAAWSLAEYTLHRYVGHGPKRRAPTSVLGRLTPSGLLAEFNREHLAHHADPRYFAPTSRKVLAAAAVIPVVTGALAPIVGVRRAASFAAGFTATYAAYEILHRRIHTHPPKGRYGRWARRHHLQHHLKDPRANHGVTSPIWDHAFRTLEPLRRVRITKRTAPPWFFTPDGALASGLADDYELVGERDKTTKPLEDQGLRGGRNRI